MYSSNLSRHRKLVSRTYGLVFEAFWHISCYYCGLFASLYGLGEDIYCQKLITFHFRLEIKSEFI
jgi:hypothetical protein